MADHRDTLLLALDSMGLEPRGALGPWALFNAAPLPDRDLTAHCIAEQGFRPDFLALEQAGYDVTPVRPLDHPMKGALVLAHRTRAVNERNLIRAWNALEPGAPVVFAGMKTSGVQALRKWFSKQLAPLSVDLGGSLSKHHAVAFWARRSGEDLPMPEQQTVQDVFHVAPGMFSAKGPDTGSKVLAECLDHRIRGHVADFGAGWGYLSARLSESAARLDALSLFEADHASLQAARENMADVPVPTHFHWSDLTTETPAYPTGQPFDWIIMNPPFHTGRAAEPALGNTFIQTAARSLPKGGHLLMVANTNLPYEATLTQHFRRHERIAQANGFKVIEAVR